MTIDVIQCPQCGGALESVASSGFYSCPYCKSRLRVQFHEPDPNTRSDGRRVIFDRNTGGELCYVKLPRGWTASGIVVNQMQSANWPFCMYIQAESPQREARIHYSSGAAYKEVVASSLQRHVEGGYDQTEMMPLRRRQTAADYADVFMIDGVPPGTPLRLIETRPLPKLPPENDEAKRQALFQDTLNTIRMQTPPGMRSSVDRSFHDGVTRIFSFRENGVDMRQAVATIVSGVQISFGASMMLFGGMNTFLFWDVPYVLTLRARAEYFERHYDSLVMFCSTMQASPALASRIIDERNRILGFMADRQRTEFAAHQKRMQEQQAAFDAYNRAWMARSHQTHQAARTAGAATQAAEDRLSDMRSEATRGVNTYIRPDGTEVEYSVVNEAAFANANDSRTTFATESKSFQSIDWVEMKRKY